MKAENKMIINQKAKLPHLSNDEDDELMKSRMDILEGIARGERAILAGNTHTHEEAKERLKKWFE